MKDETVSITKRDVLSGYIAPFLDFDCRLNLFSFKIIVLVLRGNITLIYILCTHSIFKIL